MTTARVGGMGKARWADLFRLLKGSPTLAVACFLYLGSEDHRANGPTARLLPEELTPVHP